MRQVEIQAFSVEEAVRLALEQLGRSRDQVKVEVLATDPGSEEVLVRVTAQDARPGGDEEASPRRTRPPGAGPAAGPGSPPPGRGGGIERGNRLDRGDRGRPDRGPGAGRGPGDRPRSGGGGGAGGGRYQGPQGWDRSPIRAAAAAARENRAYTEAEDQFEEDDRGNRSEAAVALDSALMPQAADAGEHATPEDAVAPVAAEILQKVLIGMRVRCRIVRRDPSEEGEAAFPDDQQSLTLNVTGLNERDQSTLIGRRGETLEALQFLVNLVVGRQVDLWTRVIIDIEGYRLRRKFALINLAKRTAEQVQSRNQAIPLEAMPPYERRIIHMALSEHPDVVTESSGAEPERRVVILPR